MMLYEIKSHVDQCLNIKEQHTQHLKQLHDSHQKEVCYYGVHVEITLIYVATRS